MPAKNRDLHGNVPDDSPAALLLIDVINHFEYEDGETLLAQALPMAERLADLKRRAKKAGIPAVYANDNWGRWQSDFHKIVDRSLASPGRPVVERLLPEDDDYFVLKPKHSAFFSTTLDTLLDYLGVRTLVITGIAGNNCVLFTAADAFMRDLHLVVPADCVVSIDAEDNRLALAHMRKVLDVDVRAAGDLDLRALAARPRDMESRRSA
jgi:nicotinamidase-related amidase